MWANEVAEEPDVLSSMKLRECVGLMSERDVKWKGHADEQARLRMMLVDEGFERNLFL